ncbi:hypothetical protein CYMTET_22949 [Cymbomonas tetramitiformis]|uniref:RsmI HTH domain-containing protein n=1 Tax=Cymbomonas tetramitiformis TaxID=36881 RepID=A0AAE0FZF0_9CHLO|nr:hypothetical protein CYMTET_22949 [Cymbomonas tetramitiformis]
MVPVFQITLLVEGATADIVSESAEWSEETLRSYLQDLHEQGISPSAAAREVASETGIKKNEIYRLALEIKNGSGALFICAKQQRMREAQERANKAVEAQLKAEEDAREARDRVAAAEAALEAAEERARTAEAEKEKAHAQVDKLVGQVHNLEQEVQQLQSELSSANLEIKKLGDELESSQMKLKVTEEEKEKLSGDKASLSIRVDTLEKDSQSQLAKIEALENAQHEQEIDSQKALNQSSSLKGMLEEKDKEIARLQEIERLKAQLLEQSQAPPAAAVKASDVPKDDPEFLKKLFGQRGLWRAVSNNAQLQDISEQACEYITNKYATEVVLTETAYDADKAPHKDSDEPDDLNTYDDNVFTVTYSTALENKVPVGDDLPRAENTGHYHAANQNTHIEKTLSNGVREDIFPTTMPMLKRPNELPRVHGSISFFTDKAMLMARAEEYGETAEILERQLNDDMTLVAEGVGKTAQWIELQQVEDVERQVTEIRQPKPRPTPAVVTQSPSPVQPEPPVLTPPKPVALPSERRVELQMRMQGLMSQKRQLEQILSKMHMKRSIGEMRRYRKPKRQVVGTMLSLMLLLNYRNLQGHLPEDPTGASYLPLHPNAVQQMWGIASRMLNPLTVVQHMRNCDPAVINTDIKGEDGGEMNLKVAEQLSELRYTTALRVMSDIGLAQTRKCSMCAGVIYEWVKVMMELRMLAMELSHVKNQEDKAAEVRELLRQRGHTETSSMAVVQMEL